MQKYKVNHNKTVDCDLDLRKQRRFWNIFNKNREYYFKLWPIPLVVQENKLNTEG